MKKLLLIPLLALALLLVLGGVAVAQECSDGEVPDPQGGCMSDPLSGSNNPTIPGSNNPISIINIKIDNPFNCGGVSDCTLFKLAESIVNNIILPIGGVLAVLAFIYSGFLYVMAQGDTKQIETAHKSLLFTAIGTALLLGAWVFASVIENTINQLL